MQILGLTGSIGMGKSATSDMFRALGVSVHDSDSAVHSLYSGEATPLIEDAFPGVTRDGVVDRTLLSARVISNPEALKKLEGIVHPLVRKKEQEFLDLHRRNGSAMVVVDIPLLFEARDPKIFDAIVVVSAPADVQAARVLARPGMTAEKLAAILVKQTPDAEKRRRAHFVVNTAEGFPKAFAQVTAIVRCLASRQTANIAHA